ncbi:hypothetical protein BJY52DRAFT_1224688 [Lactarius psammicola]|nr:hypothetical protein BJY52DRAFT_1224688 [Lactarius psammicola]
MEAKQGRTKKYPKKLVGKANIEDALKRLDKLTQEEVRVVTAQLLKTTHSVDDKVTKIDDEVRGVVDKVKDINDSVKLVLDDEKRQKESCNKQHEKQNKPALTGPSKLALTSQITLSCAVISTRERWQNGSFEVVFSKSGTGSGKSGLCIGEGSLTPMLLWFVKTGWTPARRHARLRNQI